MRLTALAVLCCYMRLRSSKAQVAQCGRSSNAASGWLPGGGWHAGGHEGVCRGAGTSQADPARHSRALRLQVDRPPYAPRLGVQRNAEQRPGNATALSHTQPLHPRRRYTLAAATPSPPLHPRPADGQNAGYHRYGSVKTLPARPSHEDTIYFKRTHQKRYKRSMPFQHMNNLQSMQHVLRTSSGTRCSRSVCVGARASLRECKRQLSGRGRVASLD